MSSVSPGYTEEAVTEAFGERVVAHACQLAAENEQLSYAELAEEIGEVEKTLRQLEKDDAAGMFD